METENIRVARERGFTGVFTTNANRLTQHISRLLGYEILSSVQVIELETWQHCGYAHMLCSVAR